MIEFYTETQRQLQNEFGTVNLADRIVEAVVAEELSGQQAEFINSRNMFYLSTIDEFGFPSCSYKGGQFGFVRVVNPKTIIFPSYDGNGMYMSMGNIEAQSKVGLLFIDFENPQRVRVRGEAKCIREGSLVESYPGSDLVVEITVSHVWVNCPRYVHKMQPLEQSPYVPQPDGSAPLALWKRVDLLQDVLTAEDRHTAEAAGLISIKEYDSYVSKGKLV